MVKSTPGATGAPTQLQQRPAGPGGGSAARVSPFPIRQMLEQPPAGYGGDEGRPPHPQLHKLAGMIEQIPIGIAITAPTGEIEYLNPYLSAVIGLSVTEAAGVRLCAFRLGKSRYRLERVRRQLLSGNAWQGETQIKRPTGETFHALESIFPLREADGTVTHFIHFLQDIGGRKLAETLRRLAFYDSLTGLPNRNLMHERLGSAIARAKRNRSSFALMYIDVDGFKQINDTLGHDAGDGLLRAVAARLKRSLRESDTLARIGGDEFVVIIENSGDRGTIAHLADKLLAACVEPCIVGGSEVPVTLSIGVSFYPHHAGTMDALLKSADSAMYRAKAAGGNTYHILPE
ncbi:MAG: sensor domain-containing diguanylate cyclase [Betaproteobacteria bacterium]|nr:sensor domain-containing diguanylate cyclase [Betaproteobacteria bacterium]